MKATQKISYLESERVSYKISLSLTLTWLKRQ